MILKVAMPGKVQFKLIRREPAFFMAHEGDIHYIGGADVLPAPLETEQENEVIQDLATEEYAQEARSILIEHNLRLVVYIAKKFDNTGVGVEDLDHEGRLITLEYPNCFIATCYTPNAQDGLKRLDHRMAWDDAFRAYLVSLDRQKPVIVCGDLNVAHQEIDLKNPGPNRGNAGFSDEERGKFTELLNAGFTDTWRAANPDVESVYSWWSYRFNARKNNAGWRIDYFLVSDSIANTVRDTGIRGDIFGSDHCPVTLTLEL